MRTINAERLQSILAKHAAWLRDEEDGERANLSYANLSYANLSRADLSYANLRGADLRGADLRGANIILVGQTADGYLVYAYPNSEGVVVGRAGCQTFVGIAAARTYASRIPDEYEREDALSLIDRCARMATVRGWKLEPATQEANNADAD